MSTHAPRHPALTHGLPAVRDLCRVASQHFSIARLVQQSAEQSNVRAIRKETT